MKHVKEHEVEGVRAAPPYARTLKHLVAPWALPAERMWVGMSKVDLGSRSNRHSHDQQEEIFYVVSGRGEIEVGEEKQAVEPGSIVVVPPTLSHSLINTGDETLKVLSVVSPPFEKSDFEQKHKLVAEDASKAQVAIGRLSMRPERENPA
jgi:mannose-6-phosphate isomerase-like protein (cupin superfamily)